MTTRTFLLLFSLAISVTISFAQSTFQGELSSPDSARYTVLRTYPDSFPNVSVIFRAQSPGGGPIWDLHTDNVIVTENDRTMDVLSVQKLSNEQRVNTGLVIDHSGSMKEYAPYQGWLDSVMKQPGVWQTMTLREYTKGKKDSDSLVRVCVLPDAPAHLRPPIWHARLAAQQYIRSLDTTKDAVSVIGFSDRIVEKVSLNVDYSRSQQAVGKMTADGSTAFYDAVYTALEEVNKGVGIKAVVALTDGQDNASKHTLADVIKKSLEYRIPVFCVGLGDANYNNLQTLASSTGGTAWFTRDATTLGDIYQKISGEVMSIYELVYHSSAMEASLAGQDVDLVFEIPQKVIKKNDLLRHLPAETETYVEQKEEQVAVAPPQYIPVPEEVRAPEGDDDNWLLSAGVAVALAGAGVITARYTKQRTKKNTKTPFDLVNVYPNPTSGPLTLVVTHDVSAMPGQIMIHDVQGRLVHTEPFVFGSSRDMDLSFLGAGQYVISVQAAGQMSTGKMVVVQ